MNQEFTCTIEQDLVLRGVNVSNTSKQMYYCGYKRYNNTGSVNVAFIDYETSSIFTHNVLEAPEDHYGVKTYMQENANSNFGVKFLFASTHDPRHYNDIGCILKIAPMLYSFGYEISEMGKFSKFVRGREVFRIRLFYEKIRIDVFGKPITLNGEFDIDFSEVTEQFIIELEQHALNKFIEYCRSNL